MFDVFIFLCFLAMVFGPAIVGSFYGIRTSEHKFQVIRDNGIALSLIGFPLLPQKKRKERGTEDYGKNEDS